MAFILEYFFMLMSILKKMFGYDPEEVSNREDSFENQNIGEDLDEVVFEDESSMSDDEELLILDDEEFLISDNEEYHIAVDREYFGLYNGFEKYPPTNPDSLIVLKFQNGIFPEHLKVTTFLKI